MRDMDTITFKKIWEDERCFELEIAAQSECVGAKTTCYADAETISRLAACCSRFPCVGKAPCRWECGRRGDGTTPYVSLEIVHYDRSGHVRIEIFMELDDGGPLSRHTCCFFVQTELGALNRFGSRLSALVQRGVGQTAALE